MIRSLGDATLAQANASWSADADAAQARAEILSAIVEEVTRAAGTDAVDPVGYRVVHGGRSFLAPTPIDDGVVDEILSLDELAPLDNRIAADAIRGARRPVPNLAHVA